MKIKSFIYVTKNDRVNAVIRIKAKRKPSSETVGLSGTWVVYELYEGKWVMPCFPEITWRALRGFAYLGILQEANNDNDEGGILIRR